METLHFPDFITKCLLYTTSLFCKNKDGMNHVDNIDENHCFQIWKLYENEYIWKSETQMFEMTYIKICKVYIKALSEYKIDEFISIVDPCNRIRDTWPEKHVKFIKYIQTNIINAITDEISKLNPNN